jgi:hypothetical protein
LPVVFYKQEPFGIRNKKILTRAISVCISVARKQDAKDYFDSAKNLAVSEE